MSIIPRIVIVLVTAVFVFAAVHYLIQILDLAVGSWKYCFIIAFGVALIPFVWRLTSPNADRA